MGLLDKLFGRPDYRQGILDSTVALVNETEHVYRNNLQGTAPTADGLLKVRLLSAAFGAAVYLVGECAKSDEDGIWFMYACIDIAMRPFSQPCITQATRREPHILAALGFSLEVFKLIQPERTDGPSYIEEPSEAFYKLVEVYQHCVKESVGDQYYESHVRRDSDISADSVIWTHLRFLDDSLQQIRQ